MKSISAIWEVEIFRGASEVDVTSSAPMKFGTPYITAGSDDGARVSLVYGPVELFSIDDSLVIRTTAYAEDEVGPAGVGRFGRPTDHREMFRPQWEADWGGDLRISGFEERADGELVRALWVVRPYGPDEEEPYADESE